MNRERDRKPEYTGKTITDHIRFLRDTFSDEIPGEVIHSDAKNNRFKVRRNWWVGLLADLENGLEDGEFSDPQVQREIKDFTEFYYHRPNFFDKPLTTADDIARANSLIRRILGEKPQNSSGKKHT